jgi:hypothetical protein
MVGDVAYWRINMQTHTVVRPIANALINAFIAYGKNDTKVTNAIDKAWHVGQHKTKRNDWNANLSFKTAQKLKAQGILE